MYQTVTEPLKFYNSNNKYQRLYHHEKMIHIPDLYNIIIV